MSSTTAEIPYQQWRKVTCQWWVWEIWKSSLAFDIVLSLLGMHRRGILNSCDQVTVVAGNGNIACHVQKERIVEEDDWGGDSSVAITLYTNTTKELAGLREKRWLIMQGQKERHWKKQRKKWHLEKGFRTREKGLRFFLLSF